jgi:hypothetical protein
MWVRDAAARIEGRGYCRSFIVCRGFFADGENVMGRRKRWGGTRRVGSWVSSYFDDDDGDDGDDNDVAGTSILVPLASTTWVPRHDRAGECGWRANE